VVIGGNGGANSKKAKKKRWSKEEEQAAQRDWRTTRCSVHLLLGSLSSLLRLENRNKTQQATHASQKPITTIVCMH
jgi:hypothetical protein